MSLKSLFIADDDSPRIPRSLPVSGANVPMPSVAPVKFDGEASVDAVFEQAGLTDRSRSIYKVAEIRKSFPQTLPAETIKASMTGLMSAMQLTSADVKTDAERRLQALNDAKVAHAMETADKVDKATDDIAKLSAQIQELQVQITNDQKADEDFAEAVDVETKLIIDNLSFVPTV